MQQNNRKQQLVDFFDKISTHYHNAFLNDKVAREQLDSLIFKWELNPGQSVLEVGCGPGHLTGFLAEAMNYEGQITLLDLSASMIALAKKNNVNLEKKMSLRYCIGDIHTQDLHLIFDRIVIFNAFPHFFDKVSALLNCSRHLKQDGMVIISHNNCRQKIINIHQRKGLPESFSNFPPKQKFYTITQLSEYQILSYQDDEEQDFFLVKLKPQTV